MQNKTYVRNGLMTAATLSMLVACGPAPTPVVSPSAGTSATPASTATPAATPTPAGTPTPTETASTPAATPTPTATATASTPAATPTPTATASASASASASLAPVTEDISTIEKTTFNGKVFDDTNAPLDGVKINAKSLNASVSFVAETTTTGGAYAFNNAPSGVQVEIIATKAGFTTRKRVEVLKSNKQGDPNANKYDFGTDGGTNTSSGSINNALSDKPEVIMVTPGRNASGVDPKTSVVLKFSEPMDKKTVEDTFSVRAFNARKLSVDNGKTNMTTNTSCLANSSFYSVCGDSQITTVSNNLIWDKNAYNISWNADDTEVTFAFKEERLLPSDKDSDKVPDYQVAFNDTIGSSGRLLKDKSGISRANNHFKLTDGPFEESYKFAIKPDEVKPDISSIVAQTNENQGVNGDAVKVLYSERMIIYTKTRTIAGGAEDIGTGSAQKAPAGYPGGVQATNRLAAKNYTVSITPVGTTSTTYVGTWQNLGGQAVYDTNDPTHKTVILMPPRFTGLNSGQVIANSTSTYAESSNAASAITLGATGVTTLTMTVTVSYLLADGTMTQNSAIAASVVGGPGSTAAAIATSIQASLNTTGQTGWTVSAQSSSTALRYQFAVASNATSTTVDTTPVAVALTGLTFGSAAAASTTVVPPSTTFKSTSGSMISATVGANGFVNIYAAGDTIRVVADSTILDPAGNTLNTSRDNASGNAS